MGLQLHNKLCIVCLRVAMAYNIDYGIGLGLKKPVQTLKLHCIIQIHFLPEDYLYVECHMSVSGSIKPIFSFLLPVICCSYFCVNSVLCYFGILVLFNILLSQLSAV